MSSNAILEVKNVNKTFYIGFLRKKNHVLSDLTFVVSRGEIYGFIGPNGAGKTTTIKLILSLIWQDTGEIKLFNLPNTDSEARTKLGFLPENPYFYDYLTIYEFLDLAAQLYDMPLNERKDRIHYLLEKFNISYWQNHSLRKISRGTLQRVGLAQALINRPELLILDEPMSNLDPIGRRDVRDILLELKEQGTSIFFSSHILSDAEMLCDRVGIIFNGKLISEGKLEELLDIEIVKYEVVVKGIDSNKIPASLASLVSVQKDNAMFYVNDENSLEKLLDLFSQAKAKIVSIVPSKNTLEDYFIHKIKEIKGGKQ